MGKSKSFEIHPQHSMSINGMNAKDAYQPPSSPFALSNPGLELDDENVPETPSEQIKMQNIDLCNTNYFQFSAKENPNETSKESTSNKTSALSSTIDLSQVEDSKLVIQSSQMNFLIKGLVTTRSIISDFLAKHAKWMSRVSLAALGILYFVYFGFAIAHSWQNEANYCQGIRFLTLLTVFAVGGILYFCVLKRFFGKSVDQQFIKPMNVTVGRLWKRPFVSWLVYIILLAFVVVFLAIDTKDNRQRLISAAGVVILILFGAVFSKHPGHIIWRQVIWGLGLQFAFALLILRWDVGKQIFQCLGDKVSEFLKFTDTGSSFVFGYLVTGKLQDWPILDANETMNSTLPFDGKLPLQFAVFAFKVLPVIFFFSFIISVLYFYGIMQWIVTKLGWLLQVTVGTTAAESISAAANIFVGQTEAPLIIQPFLHLMTKSELHAVMTGGFATIAGGVLAAYINFGVSASHLLSASVMSAPAALGFSKLFYPETEVSKTTADNINIAKGAERNFLEAGANGTSNAIPLVANIIANLIAFIAFIAFMNFIVNWFATLIGYDYVTFEWILSQLFIPLAFIMGVDASECEAVARLIGLKTVVNEFVAYAELAKMLKAGELSERAEAIATYALCGFSNISSIGIQLGGLGAMAPTRKSDLADIGIRALIAGSAACFMTACIAGTLIND